MSLPVPEPLIENSDFERAVRPFVRARPSLLPLAFFVGAVLLVALAYARR